MKLTLGKFTLTITLVDNDPTQTRRRFAKVVEEARDTRGMIKIQRIKAIPHLVNHPYFPENLLVDGIVKLVLAKEWIEHAFANEGTGDIL